MSGSLKDASRRSDFTGDQQLKKSGAFHGLLANRKLFFEGVEKPAAR
jgi:hypothetical protein